MKGQSSILFMSLLIHGLTVQADTDNRLQQITPALMYSYIDFDFDSTTGVNFNRFQGHSNLYSLGADNFKIIPDLTAGLFVFRVDTIVNSQFLLASSSVIPSHQDIKNNTLFGHIRKRFNTSVDLDIAGGYGQNKISSYSWIGLNTPEQILSTGNHHSNNWFSSINGFYKKQWTQFSLKAYAGVLYSQIHSGRYAVLFQPNLDSQNIEPLTNKVTYVMEGAELGYKLNSQLTPFINGGLIQVAQFKNSRATLMTPINGSLPQLNMDQNGFKLGAGFVYTHKQLTLRIEEKYYNAANTYTSYQTLAGLEYHFS